MKDLLDSRNEFGAIYKRKIPLKLILIIAKARHEKYLLNHQND